MSEKNPLKIFCVPLYGYVGRDMVAARTEKEAHAISCRGIAEFEESDDFPANDPQPCDVDDVYEYGDGDYEPEDIYPYLLHQRKAAKEDRRRDAAAKERARKFFEDREKFIPET